MLAGGVIIRLLLRSTSRSNKCCGTWQCCTDVGEIEMFYNLLITYTDVMPYSTSDLGRTHKLRHHNDMGYEPPVQQPVHRISPH